MTVSLIADLEHLLRSTVDSLGLSQTQFGNPQLVAHAEKEVARLYEGASKPTHSKQLAYEAALKFLRGRLDPSQDEFEFDLLATALCQPIQEQRGASLIGSGFKFDELLEFYEEQAKAGELWRNTWFGLLSAYFSLEPKGNGSADGQLELAGWRKLRVFLEKTWPTYAKTTGLVPSWMEALRTSSGVLSEEPCAGFARQALHGDRKEIEELSTKLGIPPSSWFWHRLVVDVVKEATTLDDVGFKESISLLIELIKDKPVFRNEALVLVLTRYFACENRAAHELLRDYVIDKSVWKNPKLKAAGLATAWNQVSEDVWRMVMGWVAESNLKLFFELLSARNGAEDGRFAFWSRYVGQINWTKLVFGGHTHYLARHNKALADLLKQEEGVSASLQSNDDHVDAFIIEIGNYTIVEFSKKPNAAYIYPTAGLPFEKHAVRLSDGTERRGLKAGYSYGNCERIFHQDGWEERTAAKLSALGVRPDKALARLQPSRVPPPLVQPTPFIPPQIIAEQAIPVAIAAAHPVSTVPPPASTGHQLPQGAPFTLGELQLTVKAGGGRVSEVRLFGQICVVHDNQHSMLAQKLRQWGFKWDSPSEFWYYAGNQQATAPVSPPAVPAPSVRPIVKTPEQPRTPVLPAGAPFTLEELEHALAAHGARIGEYRLYGALCIVGSSQSSPLSSKLTQWGFKWDNPTGYWYYVGNAPAATTADTSSQKTVPEALGATFSLDELNLALTAGGGWIANGHGMGRICVVHSSKTSNLARKLSVWGFQWHERMQLWYFGKSFDA